PPTPKLSGLGVGSWNWVLRISRPNRFSTRPTSRRRRFHGPWTRTSAACCRRSILARRKELHRLRVGQHLRRRRLGDGRVGRAVSDVRTVSSCEHFDRRAVFGELAKHFLLRGRSAARLLGRPYQRQRGIKRDVEHILFRLERSELVAVLQIWTETTEVRRDRFVVVRMDPLDSRQR